MTPEVLKILGRAPEHQPTPHPTVLPRFWHFCI